MLDIQLIKNNIDFTIKQIQKKYCYINNNESKITNKINIDGVNTFKQIKQNIESDLEDILFKINTLDKIIQFLSEDANTRDAIDFITKYKK